MFDAEKAVNDQRAAIERIQKHLYHNGKVHRTVRQAYNAWNEM
jgi:hypothetical protein